MKTIRNSFTLVLLVLVLIQSVAAQSLRGWGGWRPGTKGAVIGAGVGGAAGAIINKRNRAVGAVIGAAAGGAAGYAYAKSNSRRKWSPQARGTAIGAGTGAAAGAIINKRNRAVGAVIGGVAGAAGGYAIGKHIDNKRKKEEAARLAAQQAAEREAAARAAQTPDNVELAQGASNRTYTTTAPVAKANTERLTNVFEKPSAPVPYVLEDGLLTNETYGDLSTPYGMSKVRRKSW